MTKENNCPNMKPTDCRSTDISQKESVMQCLANSKNIRVFWNSKQTEKELQKIAAEHFECESEEPHQSPEGFPICCEVALYQAIRSHVVLTIGEYKMIEDDVCVAVDDLMPEIEEMNELLQFHRESIQELNYEHNPDNIVLWFADNESDFNRGRELGVIDSFSSFDHYLTVINTCLREVPGDKLQLLRAAPDEILEELLELRLENNIVNRPVAFLSLFFKKLNPEEMKSDSKKGLHK